MSDRMVDRLINAPDSRRWEALAVILADIQGRQQAILVKLSEIAERTAELEQRRRTAESVLDQIKGAYLVIGALITMLAFFLPQIVQYAARKIGLAR